jgi:hypothetical protein
MFSKLTLAAALALVVSGLAGTAQAYDAFGAGDHEMVIRQAAQSPKVADMTKASDWASVGTNAWIGDRDGLILAGASAGSATRTAATTAR